ncbi:hypothetical protein AB0B01_23895 [Streptomyces sp. NPDC044571]|uniref:LppU/SCO3897 family protein n=1 Tax=Streptomyces sp. NPDC044571 TaxID=3155371 RepID=UPI0034078C43
MSAPPHPLEQPVSSQEIPLTLTPQQAASGVVIALPLPTGTSHLRIPPARDGDLVRTRVGDTEVLLRIRVSASASASAGTARPAASGASGAKGCLLVLGVAAAVIVGLVLLNSGDDEDDRATATPTPSTPASSRSPAPGPAPAGTPADTATDTATDPATEAPATPSEAAPSPFDRGTCLNGQLPDSTTAQRVTGVREVSCAADDAHYRVIESIPLTSDLNRCEDNPKTQYAFSYRYTRGGITLNEYVYCLVGLGSYAR